MMDTLNGIPVELVSVRLASTHTGMFASIVARHSDALAAELTSRRMAYSDTVLIARGYNLRGCLDVMYSPPVVDVAAGTIAFDMETIDDIELINLECN
jgi:hypothetical protein